MMMLQRALPFLPCFLLLSACTSSTAESQDVLTRVNEVTSHPDCEGGASIVAVGADDDGDGVLDDDEVESTVVVCGVEGGGGTGECEVTTGATTITVTCPGFEPVMLNRPTSSEYLVTVTDAEVPDPCPRGGVVVQSGLDDGAGDGTAGNGQLELDEVTESITLCAAYCGDGTTDVELGETCDDGGTAPHDGCDEACQTEPSCLPPDPDPACPAPSYHVDVITPSTGPTAGGILVTFEGDFPANATAENTTLVVLPDTPVTPTAVSSSEVSFTLPQGVGTVSFELTIAGAPVPFWRKEVGANGLLLVTELEHIPFRYDPPAVNAIFGCDDGGGATRNCPLAGGAPLTLTGSNFGADPEAITVTVGSLPCTELMVTTPHQEVTCTLPAQVAGGHDLDVRINVAGQLSSPVPLVSYESPRIVAGSLRLAGETHVDPVELPTAGGAVLEIAVTGLSLLDETVRVTYGDLEPPFECDVDLGTSTPELLRCTTGPSFGGPASLRVHQGLVASPPSVDRVTHPAPILFALRASPGGPEGDVVGTRQWGNTIYVDVLNIIDAPEHLRVHVGPYPCEQVEVTGSGPHTVSCVTTHGAGGPHPVVLTALGQASAPSAQGFSYPIGPVLDEVLGCSGQSGAVTTDCSTRGGDLLSLVGTNFSAPVWVTVGGTLCEDLHYVDSTELRCTLPPGVGEVPVVVHGEGLMSPPVSLRYAQPMITGIAGCDDVGSTATECPQEGGKTLTLTGTNFGQAGALVFVGGALCANVTHDLTDPHERLTCTLPPGGGVQPVWIVNGTASTSPFHLSYAP